MNSTLPNIVVLLADQLRPFELSCYGHPVVQTPNIDRLAAMGTRFEHAVTPNPVCTAARSALISGQYSRTCIGMLGCCGEPLNARPKFPDTTLPEILNTFGYETFLCGKWHVEPNPLRLGFERAFYPNVSHKNRQQYYHDGVGRTLFIDDYCPDAELRATREFLNTKRERPFFLFHNFCLPHMPYFDVPSQYLHRFRPDDAVLRPNVFHQDQMWHDERALEIYWRDRDAESGVSLPDGFDLRRLTAAYYGLVTAVDDQVGEILRCLESAGQLDNTIIVFSSDHGENLGSHWLWNKISVNEEAIRVPFIWAWPGRIAQQVVTDHVGSLVDVAPTLLTLAAGETPSHMQGRDLSSVLKRRERCVGDGSAVIENLRGEIALRTPHHLYSITTRTKTDGPEREIIDDRSLFYDMRTDPYQQSNLAGGDEQFDIGCALRDRLLAWDRATRWMPSSRGGLYAQGPKHDMAAMPRSFGALPTRPASSE